MQLNKKTIDKIKNKYKELFDALEQYDRTREWPIGRERIDVTLDKRMVLKLRDLRKRTGKPISHMIEEALQKNF